MALIECNECGAQISDKASVCPKCGNPLEPIAIEQANSFFKSKLFRDIFLLVKIVIILAIVSSLGLFIINKHANEIKTQEVLEKTQEVLENSQNFKMTKAGRDILKQELNDCTDSDISLIFDMNNQAAIDFCNLLNEESIKFYNTPLNGLGINSYEATYTNDSGNRVKDKFFVFFKDEKPIKIVKHDILKKMGEHELFLLIRHHFK